MNLLLVTGGARSGKSSYAQRRAIAAGGPRVSYIATALPSDEDMRTRIEHHRRSRPAEWETIEAPTDAAAALRRAQHQVVLLDCVTTLAAQAIPAQLPPERSAFDQALARVAEDIIGSAGQRGGTLILVTNEVGLSIHPSSRLGRWFQDALGRINQDLAARADEVVLMVSGLPLPIKSPAPWQP